MMLLQTLQERYLKIMEQMPAEVPPNEDDWIRVTFCALMSLLAEPTPRHLTRRYHYENHPFDVLASCSTEDNFNKVIIVHYDKQKNIVEVNAQHHGLVKFHTIVKVSNPFGKRMFARFFRRGKGAPNA